VAVLKPINADIKLMLTDSRETTEPSILTTEETNKLTKNKAFVDRIIGEILFDMSN